MIRRTGTFAVLLATVLFIVGCGNNNSPDISGNWTATTTSTSGGSAITFTMTMQEGAANGNTAPVTISNINFVTQNNCFTSSSVGSGTITTTTAGQPRDLAIDIFSGAGNTGNHAALALTVPTDNNSASGTYTLTGGTGACTNNDAGNVTLTRM